MLLDGNAIVVANACAALLEITKNSLTRAIATEPPCREEKADAVGPGKKINDSRAPVIPGTFLNAAEQQRQQRQQ